MSIAEKLITVAENVPKVYNAGRKSEYNSFWDAFQQNGNRTDYASAFYGKGWDNATFKPKYDIKPAGRANHLIYNTQISGDLVALLEAQNVTLDTSGATRMQYGFAFNYQLTRIGVVDLSSSDTGTTYLFNGDSALETIDKLIVNENTVYTYWFDNCSALEEIRFEGIIGKSLDIHWGAGLSFESLASIVGALSDTVTGQTITLPTTAESTYDSTTYVGRWAEIVASKPNWEFEYI